jgi:uncharacterized membrane protein
MMAELLVLRLVHILGGMIWVGSGIFTTFFLLPTLAQAGPAAGQVIAGLQRRRLFTILPIVALLTILSGVRLMQITSAGFSPAYFNSASGRTYAWSGVAAIVGFLIGVIIARPAAIRAAKLGGSMAQSTDAAARAAQTATLERYRRTSSIASLVSVALVVLAAAGMAVARYLR